jgi:hypothetical protein
MPSIGIAEAGFVAGVRALANDFHWELKLHEKVWLSILPALLLGVGIAAFASTKFWRT